VRESINQINVGSTANTNEKLMNAFCKLSTEAFIRSAALKPKAFVTRLAEGSLVFENHNS